MAAPTVDPDLDVDDTDLDEDRAHIVKDKNADAKILEARIYGYKVEAICGKRFIPSRDHDKLKVCERCQAIYSQIIGSEIQS